MRRFAVSSLRLPVFAAAATITSAICLGPTFLTGAWFFPTVFAVVAVTVGCEVARRVASTAAAVPLGGLVALLGYLLLRYGRDEAFLHVVPTGASIDRLGDLVASGRADIERYAAPIGVSPGVQFLTVAGVGLVALAVDTLAVTWRRAALAGLPLLVLYTVPTAVAPDGVNWVAFAVGAIGFMALLLAEARERVSRWGRPMTTYVADRPNWRPEVETAPLAQVGRRVGATALGLALVVPAVLPDIDSTSFGLGGGFGFGTGDGSGNRIAVVNPILDLGKNLRRAEDQVVIQYRGKPTYLRLVAADEFTGDQWRPSELQVSRDDNNVEEGLRRAPGLGADVKTTTRRYRIDVGDLEQNWLPLPYPSRRVSIDGTWLYDESTFNVFGENASTRQLTYDVTAFDVQPTPDQLRSAEQAPGSLSRYLEVPDDLPRDVALEAVRVVGDRPTAYDQALALQDWLRSSEFTYSTEVEDTIGDGNGSSAILGFLETRAGYCVHFASTMAVMARLLDIPARVAVGFTRGTPTGDGSWLVGLHDAHSWPELYFEGVGWVAFEPTPGERTGDPPPWARADAAGGGDAPTPGSTAEPSTDASPGPRSPRTIRERQDVLGLPPGGGGGGGSIGAGPVQVPVVPLAIGVGVLALLSVPGLTRLVVRRRRWRRADTAPELARAAWTELQDVLVDYGYAWQPSDSPRRGVARLVASRGLDPDAADAARRLAGATEQARYAPVMTEPDGDLRDDVETVKGGLAATAGRWGRWRAVLLPRSTRAVSSALGDRFADGLDAMDATVASVTGRLRPRRG